MCTYSFPEVNRILASNVVNDHYALLRIDSGGLQRLEECPVNIFLLFSLEEVRHTVRSKTSVSGACNGNYTRDIAGLGQHHCHFNCSKIICARCFLTQDSTRLAAEPGSGDITPLTVWRSMAVRRNSSYSRRLLIIPPPSESQTSASGCFCRT